jgi:acetyl-CoA carboxylase biotin carboxyl carrier protein
MSNDEIRELIRIANETGVAELEVQRGDARVVIKRGAAKTQEVVLPAVLPLTVATGAAAPMPTPPVPMPVYAISESASPPVEENTNIVVKSPIVGTYYDAPAPGEAPFVRVGDPVEPKQVLCIIESMKLMNEIEAEIAGTVVAKLVENGRPVEYGESLFTIRPS